MQDTMCSEPRGPVFWGPKLAHIVMYVWVSAVAGLEYELELWNGLWNFSKMYESIFL